MIKIIYAYYQKQFFSPGILGVFINPFYFARSGLHTAITELASNLSGNLLDIGCGSKPYRLLFYVDRYIGIEIDTEITREKGVADHYYNGTHLPYNNESFDSALCNQVLEHVFNPDIFLSEIARILKPGGRLLLTVPFIWDEHEQPFDYARYSSFGLKSLLEKHGFKYIQCKKLGGDPSCIFQLINTYLYKITLKLPKPARLILTVSLMASINILGIVARAILPANPDLYLDNVVLAEKHE